MKTLLLTLLVVMSVVFILCALFVFYFKVTRKGTWREAVSQAVSDILM